MRTTDLTFPFKVSVSGMFSPLFHCPRVRVTSDQCDHTHPPHSETVWPWLRSEGRWETRDHRASSPLSRVSRSHDTVSKLTKLTSQRFPISSSSLHRKNLDSICPAAGSVECSVRRTSGTLLFYWHKDCFMWGQSDGPELLPYFGTKKSR